MHVRQIVLGIVLGGLVSSPEFARVQGRRHEMGMQDGRMATLGCGTRGSDTATPLAGMRARLGAPPPEEP